MTAQQPTIIPTLQVRPNMLLVYNTYEWPNGRPSRAESKRTSFNPGDQILLPGSRSNTPAADEPAFKKRSAYSGQLCTHSKKRLQKAINLLVEIAEPKQALNFRTNTYFTFKVNFVTLTLPAPQGSIKDSEIKKKCLDPWLKAMRRRFKLRSYVWRAERQYNGNVHFHITTDTYLPYDNLCNEWNHQLEKTNIMDKHAEKHGHRSPNSTDIHSVQQIDNLAGYMVKYMSKDPAEHLEEINAIRKKAGKKPIEPEKHPFRKIEGQPRWDDPIDGKVWDCSQNLKAKARCETEIDSEAADMLRTIIDSAPDQTKQTDHCFLVFANGRNMANLLSGYVLQLWIDYLEYIRNYERKRQTPQDVAQAPPPSDLAEPPPPTYFQMSIPEKFRQY